MRERGSEQWMGIKIMMKVFIANSMNSMHCIESKRSSIPTETV